MMHAESEFEKGQNSQMINTFNFLGVNPQVTECFAMSVLSTDSGPLVVSYKFVYIFCRVLST